MKALVIDDIENNSKLIGLAIKDLCETGIFYADRATRGIELAISEQPDIIFIDLGLPDIDGLQAIQILRQNNSTSLIPIIMVSASAGKRTEDRALNSGCSYFLSKPVSISKLRDIVKKFRVLGHE